jgi:hypothetical protein
LLTLLLLYHCGHEVGRFTTSGRGANYFLGILNAAYEEFEAALAS